MRLSYLPKRFDFPGIQQPRVTKSHSGNAWPWDCHLPPYEKYSLLSLFSFPMTIDEAEIFVTNQINWTESQYSSFWGVSQKSRGEAGKASEALLFYILLQIWIHCETNPASHARPFPLHYGAESGPIILSRFCWPYFSEGHPGRVI